LAYLLEVLLIGAEGSSIVVLFEILEGAGCGTWGWYCWRRL